MKSQNFNYSYSVFVSETQILSNQLSNEEIFDYFMKKSGIFKKYYSSPKTHVLESKSQLENIINLLYDSKLACEFINTHTQTDFEADKENLNYHMKNIDENYLNKLSYYKLSTISNAEEQMNSYKKSMQERYEHDLADEVYI